MSKILDLSVYKEDTLDITMPDSTVIHITKPTQSMVIKVLQMRSINENTEPEKIVSTFNALVLAILNSNDAGISYNKQMVEQMPMKMKTAIINAYSDFITDLQSDPN